MPTRLILDTDIGTDVDDALALAFALRHPEIDLVAVTTVADDAVRRADIVRKLLQIEGRDDIEVAPGLGWEECPAPGRKSWFGHEGEGLLEDTDEPGTYARDAVSLLLEETTKAPVEIAVVGMQSNIAAAVAKDDAFAERVSRLDVMGGVFAPITVGQGVIPPSADHNLMIDPDASVRALNAGMNTMYVPLDVTVQAPLLKHHLERLRTGDDLCRALARLIDVWMDVAKMPGDVVAILHDPLTVACVVDRRFVASEMLPVTVAIHEGAVRTFIDRAEGREAEVITSVDGERFADFWLETVLG
jgi:purine nucleosidase